MTSDAPVDAQHAATIPQPSPNGASKSAASAQQVAQRLMHNVNAVVRGHDDVVTVVVCALLSGGHVLIDDLPGSGKTTLARALAKSVDADFSRVQATADLMPADITGAGMWNPASTQFQFVAGPVFANVVLVDELNRTPARTQSALMEAMAESAVTVDGTRHRLPDPFFVIATQNPLDQHGTFPLPQGQLDRFSARLAMGPIDAATELAVLREQTTRSTVDDVTAVVDAATLRSLRSYVRSVHVSDAAFHHIVSIAQATRADNEVKVGVSTRAALDLVHMAQAYAVISGRTHVVGDDITQLAPATLAHRLELRGRAQDPAAEHAVMQAIVSRVGVPLTE